MDNWADEMVYSYSRTQPLIHESQRFGKSRIQKY